MRLLGIRYEQPLALSISVLCAIIFVFQYVHKNIICFFFVHLLRIGMKVENQSTHIV